MADTKINARLHYPFSDLYTYKTVLERLNLDEERAKDVRSGRGFVITRSLGIREDVKDINGIFSSRFGKTLNDDHPFEDFYRCQCGKLMGKFNEGRTCEICHTTVKFVDNDFGYFGWIVLKDDYPVIHPSLFMALASFIGTEEFDNIICIQSKKNEDGQEIEIKKPKKEPFYGIGLQEFHSRFEEIMEFYYQTKCKSPSKLERYNDIMKDKDKIFTHSIPVFTTLLRPYKIEGGEMHYESTNSIYKILATIATKINSDSLTMNRNKKTKNELLYDFQMKVKELFDEINKILSGKKGSVRGLIGGRFNFTARSVIAPDHTLQVDEVKLSYQCLVGLLQQRIVNILHKAYNMSYNEAYIFLDSNRRYENPVIRQVIESVIKSYPRGLPVIINRNPTIVYGGILSTKCIGISENYSLMVPLAILRGLAADQLLDPLDTSRADPVNCWKAKLERAC